MAGPYTVWWWEVFETLRKLIVLGLVVALFDDEVSRRTGEQPNREHRSPPDRG